MPPSNNCLGDHFDSIINTRRKRTPSSRTRPPRSASNPNRGTPGRMMGVLYLRWLLTFLNKANSLGFCQVPSSLCFFLPSPPLVPAPRRLASIKKTKPCSWWCTITYWSFARQKAQVCCWLPSLIKELHSVTGGVGAISSCYLEIICRLAAVTAKNGGLHLDVRIKANSPRQV